MEGEESKLIAEKVINKFKDDGDFDRLRLKIVRLVKQNENVRNNITSAVKQSAALNRAGAENLTPRQLSDAIHDEISDNVMNQISDELWDIIRSKDGMKTEIAETVRTVFAEVLNTQSKTEVEIQSSSDQTELNVSTRASRGSNDRLSNGERMKPPGSSRLTHSNHDDSRSEKKQNGHDGRRSSDSRRGALGSDAPSAFEDGHSSPPGFALQGKRKRAIDGGDEDPDIPPGFG